MLFEELMAGEKEERQGWNGGMPTLTSGLMVACAMTSGDRP